MNYQEAICDALWNESEQLLKNKDIRRGIALRKSRKILLGLDRITSVLDIKDLSGIGKGTQKRSQDVIEGMSKWTSSGPNKAERRPKTDTTLIDQTILPLEQSIKATVVVLTKIIAAATSVSLMLAES